MACRKPSGASAASVAAAFLLIGALSCESPKASIDDLTRARAVILSVDGKPVQRATSRIVTRVPVALVEPGAHAFRVRVERERGAPLETLLVSATVASGRHYRFERDGETVRLVLEEPR